MIEHQPTRRNKWRLGIKVTLCVALVQIPLLVIAAILHIHDVKRDYLATVEWRSQALAQPLFNRVADLSGYSSEMQRILGLRVDCQMLLKNNLENGVVHVGVIGLDGRIITLTSSSGVNQVEYEAQVRKLLTAPKPLTTEGSMAYHTFIPVTTAAKPNPVAVIDIGFARNAVDRKINVTILYAAISFLVFLLLSFFLISGLLKYFVTQPIARLSKAAAGIARGDHPINIAVTSSDEVGLLADSFEHMRQAIADQISELQQKDFIIRSAPSAIATATLDGKLIYANPSFHYLWGAKDDDEIVGRPLQDFWDLTEHFDKIMATLLHVDRRWTGEIQARRLDDSLLDVFFSAANVLNNESQPIGLMLTSVDISGRKQAETEKEKLQAQLAQAQKMEAIGQLAGGVAHDYNNMLTVILGYSELMLEKLDISNSFHDDLLEIRKAATRSMDITQQLLAFARKQTIAPVAFDLNDAVEHTLKMLRRLIGEDIDLVWLPCNDLWPVKMDPSQLDQILTNLCINARDAIGGVGRITIETKKATFDELYCRDHSQFIPGEYVLLAVSDDGCGMDKETVSKIFEPFFTTKGVGQGTGLGLATVFGIIEQNRGFISVYSELGKGTTFQVFLSRHTDLKAESQKKIQENIPYGHAETILVVEDDVSILKLTERILTGIGYVVLTAQLPGQALQLVEMHEHRIDLLVTDVVMPDMNGKELSDRVCDLHPGIKTLFMSGYTADAIGHRGILQQNTHFIQKPFSRESLAIKVRKVLDI